MKKDEFDVIIIGSGIGGLICGCCLAKAGVNVLIVEKNANIGGYCNTFRHGNFLFDSCVHSLGNISEGSSFHNIVTFLGLNKKLDYIRFNPSDKIFSPDFEISLWNDVDQTISELIEKFPHEEKGILRFFNEILHNEDIQLLIKYKRKTFQSVLISLFQNIPLQKALSLVVFGDLGVPAQHISAYSALKHYKQFILGGGYYPRMGMGSLSKLFSDCFKNTGGVILTANAVTKIMISNSNSANGILTKRGDLFRANFIVSDCDARQTFFELIDTSFISTKIRRDIKRLKQSLSLFVVYLGIDRHDIELFQDGVNNWYLFDYFYDKAHNEILNYNFKINDIPCLLFRPNYRQKSAMIITSAPFKSQIYWKKNKLVYMNRILDKLKTNIPGLSKEIVFKKCYSPDNFSKWTGNYCGAAYGWACLPDQIVNPLFLRDNIIKNLFLCGHWCTLAPGIIGVVNAGYRVANIILKRIRQEANVRK